jgi:hypothetical protein
MLTNLVQKKCPEKRRIFFEHLHPYMTSELPLIPEAGFNPTAAHVGFAVDKVALGQVFLQGLLLFPPAGIIPPVLHYSFMYLSSTQYSLHS